MNLSISQIDGLMYYAGECDREPKANTRASLQRRGLLDGTVLTSAGQAELDVRTMPTASGYHEGRAELNLFPAK